MIEYKACSKKSKAASKKPYSKRALPMTKLCIEGMEERSIVLTPESLQLVMRMSLRSELAKLVEVSVFDQLPPTY